MASANFPYQGVLHRYSTNLVAFEHNPDPSSSPAQHTLIWIGGLGDGLLTVSYPTTLARHLPPAWRLVQILLSSSYLGWGTSSVAKDADEISQCVTYFRDLQASSAADKIVLMGHSTGCQDSVEYVTGATRAAVDGVVLQAPVSDREAMSFLMAKDVYDRSNALARDWVRRGDGEEVMPSNATDGFLTSPCCARRWLSLASPDHDGDEDFFSSDLTDAQLDKTFGAFPHSTPLCLLYGEKDQYVPDFVDKESLVQRWINHVIKGGGRVDQENSGIIKGASHNLTGDGDEVIQDVVGRVVRFLARLDVC
ncbi:MAG: hypothetical protein M1825_005968 [Sarcosagium campestre]|nr:MAG: hypothetical protein M1825_005968 [Sarcosagium campestre]